MGGWRYAAHDDEGSVLIAVLGIMIVLTVLAIGAFSMSDNNLFQSKRDRGSAQALSVAEAGLEQALWRLKSGVATGTLSTQPLTLSTGSASITTSKTTGFTFHIVSTGSSNTTPSVSRTVSTDVFSMSIWDMFFADGPIVPGGNGHMNGGATFNGSWYMKGDWPSSNGSASFNGGPFFIKGGNVALGGSASMGDQGKVDLYCDGTVNMDRINANLHTSVPDIPQPVQDANVLSSARSTAIAESGDNIQGTNSGAGGVSNDENRATLPTAGSPASTSNPRFYKVVDNDSVVNQSVVSFTMGQGRASFGRPYDTTTGHSSDDFAWDAAAGVLTVQGTIFIDAKDLYISNVKWAGRGTLVCSGNVHITGTWEPACLTVAPINANAYPTVNNVAVSATGRIEEFSPNGYGAFFSGVSWSMSGGNDESFTGAIVAPQITLGKHSTVTLTKMSSSLPPSMPGGSGQIVSSSGWQEGP